MTSTPNDRVGHPDGAKPGPGRVLFVGSSPWLDVLRTWVQNLGYPIVEEPEADMLLVVADEDVLDGLCTAKQGELLAASRALGITCLPPDLASTWLSELPVPATVTGTTERRADPHAAASETP